MVVLHGAPSLAGVQLPHLPGLAAGLVAIALTPVYWRAFPRALPADDRDRLAALLIFATASIHLGLVPGHLAAAPVESVLFAGDGAVLVVLALATGRWSGWRPAAAGLLIVNLFSYGFFVAAGLESVDDLGVACKLVELTAFGLAVLPRRGGGLAWTGATASVLVLTLSVGTLAWVGVLRDHAGASLQAPSGRPTPLDQAAAASFAAAVWADIQPYRDVSAARAAGYRPSTPASQPTVHWQNNRLTGEKGPILDPAHPQALVYANTVRGPVLLGAMFELPGAYARGPDFGGAVAGWHTHPNVCLSPVTLDISGLMTPFGNCPPLSFNWASGKMLHVWRPEMPGGPYGDLNERWVARLRLDGDVP
jgi:hypothetical protein